MLVRLVSFVIVGLTCSGLALATGTVSLTLTSPSAGQTVPPGSTVNWTIQVTVSTGDNYGLALIACDLVQDLNNPALFDIPPGDAASIPAIMSGFNRPAGISNPGENGAPSGYIGVQRGTAGQKNLIQIGGGQNTFGQAGSVIGTDPIVESGIGQSGPQAILSGSFVAPSVEGTYTFRLENAVANVLTSVGTPPQMSQVSQATVDLSGAVLTFTVGQEVCIGDMNGDGTISFGDINAFVVYQVNFAAWQSTYPGCNPKNGDINCDDVYPAFSDINPFALLMQQTPKPCPNPCP